MKLEVLKSCVVTGERTEVCLSNCCCAAIAWEWFPCHRVFFIVVSKWKPGLMCEYDGEAKKHKNSVRKSGVVEGIDDEVWD